MTIMTTCNCAEDLALPSEAFILAGGMGTRLRTVVKDVPKPMAPVKGRPFLEYLMDWWTGQGIKRFVLSIGYLGNCIEEHFGTTYAGAEIVYLHETEPRGTGGALALALQKKVFREKAVVMLNGDTWFEASLLKLHEDSLRCGAPFTMAVLHLADNTRYGSVDVNDQSMIHSFSASASGGSNINAGCYLFYPEALLANLEGKPQEFSLEQYLLPELASLGKLAASLQHAAFIDIGIPADYAKFADFVSLRR